MYQIRIAGLYEMRKAIAISNIYIYIYICLSSENIVPNKVPVVIELVLHSKIFPISSQKVRRKTI